MAFAVEVGVVELVQEQEHCLHAHCLQGYCQLVLLFVLEARPALVLAVLMMAGQQPVLHPQASEWVAVTQLVAAY
jgi:hypothetical protein